MMMTLDARSLTLAAVGLLLVGIVYADQNGHLDGLKSNVSGDDATPPAGGQPPQNQQGHQQQQGGRQPQGHQQHDAHHQQSNQPENQPGASGDSASEERPEPGSDEETEQN
jgi:hypothetical protein